MENFQYSKIKRLLPVDRWHKWHRGIKYRDFFLSLFSSLFSRLPSSEVRHFARRAISGITNNLRQFRETDARDLSYGMVLIAGARLSLFI